MKYQIKNFETEGENKFVGFIVVDEKNRLLYIDKRVSISEEKTDEQYIAEAFDMCQIEISEWQESFKLIGKFWNPITNSFE